MAHRAIPMIAFPRVRTIYIYIFFCVSYAGMRCIRSEGSYIIPGGAWSMDVARNRTWARTQPKESCL